jgi:hypothetical protein
MNLSWGATAPNSARRLTHRPALPASPRQTRPKPRRWERQTLRQQWQKSSECSKRYIRQAWRIHLQMREEYRQDVLDSASQRAKPSIQDFHERVLAEMSWDEGIRRLQEMIAMGEDGVIE